MEDKEILDKIDYLKNKYPSVTEIYINYYGSGDSFEGYDASCTPHIEEFSDSEVEDIMEEMIERADSNFNNDGSRGTIIINLADKSVNIEDYSQFMSEELNAEITIK